MGWGKKEDFEREVYQSMLDTKIEQKWPLMANEGCDQGSFLMMDVSFIAAPPRFAQGGSRDIDSKQITQNKKCKPTFVGLHFLNTNDIIDTTRNRYKNRSLLWHLSFWSVSFFIEQYWKTEDFMV